MIFKDTSSLTIVWIIFFILCCEFVLLYAYVQYENTKLRKAKNINELSKITFRFLKRNEFSKEKVLEKMKLLHSKLTKSMRFIIVIGVILFIYCLVRSVGVLLRYYYVRKVIDFPDVKDFIVLILLLVFLFTILERKVLLTYYKVRLDELSRLLEKRNMSVNTI